MLEITNVMVADNLSIDSSTAGRNAHGVVKSVSLVGSALCIAFQKSGIDATNPAIRNSQATLNVLSIVDLRGRQLISAPISGASKTIIWQ